LKLLAAGLLAALGTGAAAPAWALDVTQYGYFTCESGDCVNGGGQVRQNLTGVRYQGPWSGGHSVPGQIYQITHPAAPEHVYRATFGPDGLQDAGDLVFGAASAHSVAVFSGSYAHIDHPFAGRKIAVPKRGRLDTGLGFVYQGRFEFLPAKTSMGNVFYGTYIFFGTLTDTEENTKETGLYLTDAQSLGSIPRFQKANAGFLAKLQARYRQDTAQARPAQDDSARLGASLAAVNRVARGVDRPDVSPEVQAAAGDVAMNVMTRALKGEDGKLSAEDATIRAIEQAASNDDQARRELRGLLKP
jgi:hypothetical protein